MPKRCHKCRTWKRYSEFNKNRNTRDGYASWCRECKKANWMDYSERQRKGIGKRNGSYLYFVIYDPLDTFTDNSSFTKQEVADMLNLEYLAIGTRFRRGEHEYRVNSDLKLAREELLNATD